jgi:hypothetical protein
LWGRIDKAGLVTRLARGHRARSLDPSSVPPVFRFRGPRSHSRRAEIPAGHLLPHPDETARRFRRGDDRQPIILDQAAYDAWLDPATPAKAAKELLAHNLDGELQFRRVSRTVNSVKNQGADCVEPVNPL